jgi:hypothetical protein
MMDSASGQTSVLSPVATAPASPAARLEQSREALRVALRHPSAGHAAEAAAPPSAWAREFAALPLVGPAIDTARIWWQEHPVRAAAAIAATAGRCALGPVARQHPVVLMAAAATVGAGIVALRPWRWITRPAVVAGLVAPLASAAIGRIPLPSWISLAAALMPPREAQLGEPPLAASDKASATSSH